ncbi:gamma carbonic anhydrase family protein [Paenibacillus turpanensis]|uniref:gamma carbonic anhydrase family protein n=1 Tax=Paenibacillus turpanensis TaxID=2689078 RepID=UPI00140BB747|nr:gamma carbonic anhydrase family protein [Paenibacillus turpanensis]
MEYPFQGTYPKIHPSVYNAPGSRIAGDVTVGELSSIWFNAVLRGDLAPIVIGSRVNIQDLAVGHVNTDQPLIVEDDVSVGHSAIIHGCTIGRGTLIGMGAIVLNGAAIGEYALIGAGSLIPENKTIPPYTLSLGSPAKVVRELTEEDLQRMKRTTANYVEKGRQFQSEFRMGQ